MIVQAYRASSVLVGVESFKFTWLNLRKLRTAGAHPN